MRRPRGPGRSAACGLTLIELMVTIAIAAILAGLAAPSFREMLVANSLKSNASAMLSSLLLARGEAIKRNGRVALCKSATGTACTTDGSWEQGWIVFADVNNNAALDAGETVVQRTAALGNGLRLTGNGNIANYVSYSGMGETRMTAGNFQSGTFTLCQLSASGGKARDIVISATGRPRIEQTTVASCL
ncbi:GspH/FimT family protein [Ramlibacter sp. 2FC]|uniref:GspH/FimT family pseudopilin n=1 Tax=Ramlibacter sp. 2FC TaxID=2502188 RepID=UPI001485BA85|nr:GspH/FimT family protein [Ramlibacter sp. 2FC]